MSDKTLTDICFENFDIHSDLQKGLTKAGFIRCTPIQAMTLPLTLEGKDVAGQAQTGTGKTAAFLVALFNRLLTRLAHPERRTQDPRALILAPTRELAVQIEKDAKQIGVYIDLKVALIYGGVDYEKQRRILEDGVDIIIATPGRLIDFVKQRTVSLSAIDIMIMDEADRMFDLGFIKDIRFLLRRMPNAIERQNLLFSATLSHRVLELAYEHMNEPERLVVESETITAATVRQTVYFPASEEKLSLLLGLLGGMDSNRSMIFANTKVVCERVARTLEYAGFRVGVLSGDVPQKKREKLLGRFAKGELSLLVATDVAARGLHIPDVSHVFNYDLPFDAEDYVHRIGRTARLGVKGDAVSFACDEYAMSLPDIESFIEQKIPVSRVDPALLVEVPRKPIPRADGEEPQESVVGDALAEAAEERKRRRERDQRDRHKRSGRSAQHRTPAQRRDRNSGESQRSQTQSPKNSQDENQGGQPQSDPNEPSSRADSSRRRRAQRRGRKRNSANASDQSQQTKSTESNGEQALVPKLKRRIKQTIKSWVRRLGMPRRQR